MNLTPPKPITTRVARMGDYADECQRMWNEQAQRESNIDARAMQICDRLMREMDPEKVGSTLDHVAQTKELYTALADALRAGRKQQALQMLCDWIENDMWDSALSEAMDGDA